MKILIKVALFMSTWAFVNLLMGTANLIAAWISTNPIVFWINLAAVVFNYASFIVRITPEAT